MQIQLGTKQFDLSSTVLLMGILNVTPDSFSDGGHFHLNDKIKQFINQCNQSSVDIIDVGGESSRPGAEVVSVQKELDRTIHVIDLIRKESNCLISIDTTKSIVAKLAIEAGATIVNDISAATQDSKMISVCSKKQVALVLMHMKGKPKTMQDEPKYSYLIQEIKDFLFKRIDAAKSAGIKQIIIDPGIGFGKTFAHNYQLINRLNQFTELNMPILVGASRKTFLAGSNKLTVNEREEGTIVIHSQAIMNGARIIRTHDVQKGRRMISVCEKLLLNR